LFSAFLLVKEAQNIRRIDELNQKYFAETAPCGQGVRVVFLSNASLAKRNAAK